jgi:flavin-dependent dehydrogenase
MFNEFKTHHPTASDKLRKAEISRFQFHLIPLTGPIKKTCYRGLTVVGDAASQVKQTTGGGLITGLNAARLAGEAAAQALIKGDLNAISHYESRFQKLYGADFKFMGFLRRILNMFSDDALNRAFKAISNSSMEFKLNDDIELDHQMKLIFEALKNPSWVKKALSLIAILTSTWIRGV